LHRVGCGNTPTDVGKTKNRANFRATIEETPPRTWGRHLHREHPRRHRGNTPTDVGKTCPSCQSRISMEKHPHGRGEDHRIQRLSVRRRETPPRTWGRPKPAFCGSRPRRNTPTDVGKTPP